MPLASPWRILGAFVVWSQSDPKCILDMLVHTLVHGAYAGAYTELPIREYLQEEAEYRQGVASLGGSHEPQVLWVVLFCVGLGGACALGGFGLCGSEGPQTHKRHQGLVHTLVHGAYAGAYPQLLVVTGSGQSIHGGIDFPVCSQSFATPWAREFS